VEEKEGGGDLVIWGARAAATADSCNTTIIK
jgi:hypothetical protein